MTAREVRAHVSEQFDGFQAALGFRPTHVYVSPEAAVGLDVDGLGLVVVADPDLGGWELRFEGGA